MSTPRVQRYSARVMRKVNNGFESTINTRFPNTLRSIMDAFIPIEDLIKEHNEPYLDSLIDASCAFPQYGYTSALYVQLTRIKSSGVLSYSNATRDAILHAFDELAIEIDMHREDINHLNILKLNEFVATNSNEKCCICWDFYKMKQQLVELPCKHIYHKDCVIPWLLDHPKCPLCRKVIDSE
eukprot:NODE_613_length_5385_cov_1.452138.p4 type:complete len:183 gc:universal NODE_613_length_5385_cov_1.452138:2896-2348(-)